MQASVIPQYPDALADDELFRADEYDSTVAYGTDRAGFAAIRERFEADGDEIHTMDVLSPEAADVVIFVDMDFDVLSRLLNVAPADRPGLVYVMREPPSVRWYNAAAELPRFATAFDAVCTWNGRLADAHGFREYNISQYLETNLTDLPPFEDRTLLTNVSSRKYSKHPDELYSERERIARFYDDRYPDRFTLYGFRWNDPPRLEDIYHHTKLRSHTYRTYKGLVENKATAYRNHRFALAFENMTGIEGYLTEKLFDCLRAGTVPVYWGATDFEQHVPDDVVVDYRECGTPERLHDRLDAMDVETYHGYLDAARTFLTGDAESIEPAQYAESVYAAARDALDEEHHEPPSSIHEEIRTRGLLKRLESRPESLSRWGRMSGVLRAVTDAPGMVRGNPKAVLEPVRTLLSK